MGQLVFGFGQMHYICQHIMKNTRLSILLIGVLCCGTYLTPIFAQTFRLEDSIAIRSTLERAKKYILIGVENDVSEKMLDSVQERLRPYPIENTELHASYWQNMGGLAFHRAQMPKAIAFFERALAIYERCYPPGDVRLAASFHNLGVLNIEIGHYELALKFLQKALTVRRLNLKANDPDLASTLNAIGATYYSLQELSLALSYTNEAASIYQTLPNKQPSLATAYLNIGNISDDLGDYDRAIEYLRLSLAIRKAYLPPLHTRIAGCLNLLGNTYQNAFRYREAEKAFVEAIRMHEALEDRDSVLLASAYECYASLLAITGRPAEAVQLQEKAMSIQVALEWMPSRLRAIGKSTLAELYFLVGNYDKCLTANAEALRALEAAYEGKISSFTIEATALRAAALTKIGNPEEASRNCEAMLARLQHDKQEINQKSHFLRLLYASKANALFEWSKKRGDTQLLQGSLRDFATFDSLLSNSGLSLERLTSRGANYRRMRPVFEQAIQAHRYAFDKNGDQNALRQAFHFSEQARAVLLHQAAKDANAKNIAGIPDAVLSQEKAWKTSINLLEASIAEKNEEEPDSTAALEILALEEKLDRLKGRQDSLYKRIEQEYPDYYRLKYDLRVESVASVQQLLDADQALVEYFIGDGAVYVFTIGKNDYSVREIKKDFPLEQWVAQLRTGMTAFQTDPNLALQYDSLSALYTHAAFQLYQKLVAPIAADLPLKVTFVPDGILGYVPFEALLLEPPANPTRWNSHHYLLNDHPISYCYSATMLRDMLQRKNRQEPQLNFLGFAPQYNGDTTLLASRFQYVDDLRKGLAPLPHSGEEVYRGARLMRGQIFVGADATEAKFMEMASQARILHLATHGQANDRAGDYCFLVFSEQKDTVENEILYARDIYNLQLNAELVTLSACETGIGEQQGGEGIISLARAFAYAGAKSIVTSLWSVSDAKTKDLMVDFYKNLRKGLRKDEALRQAKLDFLKRNKSENAHPFYWAGFVGIGKMGPL